MPVKTLVPNRNGDGFSSRPILLLKLGINQEIDIECIAKKGQGKEHAKWSPVCLCSMKFEPKIHLNQDRHMEMTKK